MKIAYKLSVLSVLLLFACNKEDDAQPSNTLNSEAEIEQYSIAGQQDVTIDKVKRTVNVTFTGNVISGNNLVANFTLSEGATATRGTQLVKSGETPNNLELPLVYTITAEDGKSKKDWSIRATNNGYTVNWGLGRFLKLEQSNNRNYSWYYDQGNSGTYAPINCGPASTTMVAKWSDANFSRTPQDARAAYRPSGGWWYTSDIVSYLNDNNIPNRYINSLTSVSGTQQRLKDELDNGNVVILCLDAYYISGNSSSEQHTGKFYNTNAAGWGHFIVAKGYKMVDDQLYFEVYDPYSFGQSYTDGSIKGKDRYYRSDDIYNATSIWWNYAIVVSGKNTGGRYSSPAVSPDDIPAQWGR